MESIALKAYNSRQPRWPKGTSMGGQWKAGGTPSLSLTSGSERSVAYDVRVGKTTVTSDDETLAQRVGEIIGRLPAALAVPFTKVTVERGEGVSRTNINKISVGNLPGTDTTGVLEHEVLHIIAAKFRNQFSKVVNAGVSGLGQSTSKYEYHNQNLMEDFVHSAHAYLTQHFGWDGNLWSDFITAGMATIEEIVSRQEFFDNLLNPPTEKAYNPRQPRWPKGTSMGGQWKSKISGRLLDRGGVRLGVARLTDVTTIRGGLFAGGETRAVKSTVQSISGIHRVGSGLRLLISTSGNVSAPFFGAYYVAQGRIVVTAAGPHPHMTTAHEIGHYLDHKAFGSSWASVNSPKMAGWRRAVENSQAIKNWRQWEKDGFVREGRFKVGINKNVTNYYLRPREVWARAYAQYAARRSGNRSMLRELRMLQRGRLQTQWSDKDFEPIAREIDKLLRAEGWL